MIRAAPLRAAKLPAPPPSPLATPAAPPAAVAKVDAPRAKQQQCPVQRALEVIASKWAILILHHLQNGPVRFSALQRELQGVSQKVLSQQLRRLEHHGLVVRRVHPTVPPSVEYSATPAALELKPALKSLCEWAQTYMPTPADTQA
ncbi:MAG: helix-turn-helix transcriptional regulator [Phycisphaeraceae bacterium]|nr:helix-turn-helix transcriptional regulator [Phycisphaeraceae bacterium]